MRRVAVVVPVVLIALAGCATRALKSEPAPDEARPGPAPHGDTAVDGSTQPTSAEPRARAPAAPPRHDAGEGESYDARRRPVAGEGPVTAEPAYPKLVEAKDPGGAAAPASPRAVSLAGSISVTPPGDRPALPARSRVAIAFVREGKLVSRAPALLKLAHVLNAEPGVESAIALAPLDAAAGDPASLADLVRAARSQEAHVLFVDARPDDRSEARTTVVVHVPSGQVLLHALSPGTATGAPAGDLVARLVTRVGEVVR